jgi:hypothetical protein
MTHSAAQSSTHANSNGKQAIQTMARVGYAAKGVIYLIVGGLAAAAAWGAGGETTDSEGAVAKIASQPFGYVLLWIVAVGLAAYCAWRLVEAVTDPNHKGNDAKGLLIRSGYAISGIAYGLSTWTAAPISVGQASGGSESKQEWIAKLMAMPGGQMLGGLLGAAVIGYGSYQIYIGLAEKYMHKYDSASMNQTQAKIAKYSGKFGLVARGITFGIVGLFLIIAAVKLDPSETKSSGEALDVLAAQPFGLWVLLAVAIGLFCYGVFCLVQARYRDFQVGSTPG